jgi:adenylate cyclase
MSAISSPIVVRHRGRVVKQEADNLFAEFPDVQPAVDAAIDIFKAFAAVNTGLPSDQDLYAGIGIGYGKTLVVGDHDLFGCEMNLACKLGEDLARRGEILLTESAFTRLHPQSQAWEQLDLSVSNVELIAYKLKAPPAF